MKKVALCIPISSFPFGVMPQDFHKSFFEANEYLLSKINEDMEIRMFSPSIVPLSANRNFCVGEILEGGFDTSIWIDADHKIPIDGLYRLLVDGANYPIYAGMYYLKAGDHHPIVFHNKINFEVFTPIWRYPVKHLFYADMIGVGCVKIDREVFEAVDAPYFKYGDIPDSLIDDLGDSEEDRKIKERLRFKQKYGVHDVSEDVHFYRQIYEKTDFRIVIDPNIQFEHLTKASIGIEQFYRQSYLKKEFLKKKMGDKFDDHWENFFRKAELVNGAKSEEVEWIL